MMVRWPQLMGILIVSLGGAAVLLRFPPATSVGYPGCPFFAATGLLCPGCGGTRALAALLHGHWGEAWRENALLVGLLPVAASYVTVAGWRVGRGDSQAVWPLVSARLTALLMVGALGFAVWRNLR